MEDQKEIIQRFEQLRKDLNLTQKDFCKMLEMHQSNYSNLKNGEIPVPTKMYIIAQEIWGINFLWLKNGTGKKFIIETNIEGLKNIDGLEEILSKIQSIKKQAEQIESLVWTAMNDNTKTSIK